MIRKVVGLHLQYLGYQEVFTCKFCEIATASGEPEKYLKQFQIVLGRKQHNL